jgi:hypothetical protein
MIASVLSFLGVKYITLFILLIGQSLFKFLELIGLTFGLRPSSDFIEVYTVFLCDRQCLQQALPVAPMIISRSRNDWEKPKNRGRAYACTPVFGYILDFCEVMILAVDGWIPSLRRTKPPPHQTISGQIARTRQVHPGSSFRLIS